MGLTDIRIVAPDTAGGPTSYISALMADSTVAPRVAHLTYHAYGGAPGIGTNYPQTTYWVTETGASCPSCDTAGTPSQGEWAFARDTTHLVLDDIANGFTSVLIYDGYDSFYFHHNSYGFWGLLSYNQATGMYTPRKRFYTNAQVNAFIEPGSVRIGQSDSISNLDTTVAFYNAVTGKISIIGQNSGSSAITINGQLLNLPAVGSLALYTTNSSVNFQRGADVPVTANTFSVTIPANTFFSLTN
jgi:O-glycosyl hydrolase